MYVCVCECMCICIFICIYVSIYVYICVCKLINKPYYHVLGCFIFIEVNWSNRLYKFNIHMNINQNHNNSIILD